VFVRDPVPLVGTSGHASFTTSYDRPPTCRYLEIMNRVSRGVVAMLVLIGLAAAVAPLSADEAHCARPTLTMPAQVHQHGVAAVAVTGRTLLPGHGCPACPAKSCGAMHGCPVTPQLSPEFVQLRIALLPDRRTALTDTHVIPASVSHAPPTPPPLVALSPA
jgi:hypothetical protein